MNIIRPVATAWCALLLASCLNTRAIDILVAPFDFWLYRDNGVAQPADWNQPGFDDFGWTFGFSQLGFGEGDEAGEPLNSAINTAYFRTFFITPIAATYSNLTLQLLRDDGAIVYLNGVEVFRSNMPTGVVNYATAASRSIDGDDEFSIAQRVVPATVLVNGLNTLAVEVHQAVGGQDDMSFAMQVIGHHVGENQPPSAHSTSVSVDQDQSVALTLSASDPDNDPLAYTLLSFPAHGSLSGDGANLVYTPEPGYFGPDFFSFVATDGEWNTEIAYVYIEVNEVSNRAPSASNQNVSVAEDSALIITLEASDADGDELTYTHTAPAHGTLSGSDNHLLYQPAPNYFGSDSFTFTVDDGKGGTATATVVIAVASVNDAPVAVSFTASAADPTNFTHHLVVVATNNQNAVAIFSAAGSSDVDGDALSFAWYLGANATPFSTAANPTLSLPIGTHTVTLLVSDGQASSSDTVVVEIFTPCDLVKALVSQVQAADLKPSERNGLLGHLNAACATFGNGNLPAGIHQLDLFRARVDAKVAPGNPTLAETLNGEAQHIIDEVSGY